MAPKTDKAITEQVTKENFWRHKDGQLDTYIKNRVADKLLGDIGLVVSIRRPKPKSSIKTDSLGKGE